MVKPHNLNARTLMCKIRTNKLNLTVKTELTKYWPHYYWSKANSIGIISEFTENTIESTEKTFFDIYIDHIENEQYYLGKKL
jgi:hypothetical protein